MTEPQYQLIQNFPTADVKEHPLNAKIHSEQQIKQIAESMNIAYIAPLAINGNNVLIAGHGRLEAHKRRGDEFLPVVKVAGLPPEEEEKLRLSDNRIAENSKWDETTLNDLLRTIGDIPGFTDDDYSKAFGDEYQTEDPTAPEPFHVEEFKTYQAGNLIIDTNPAAKPSDLKYDIIFTSISALANHSHALSQLKESGSIFAIANQKLIPSERITQIALAMKAAGESGLSYIDEWILCPAFTSLVGNEKAGAIHTFASGDAAHINIHFTEHSEPHVECQYQRLAEFTKPTEVKQKDKYRKPEPGLAKITFGKILLENAAYISQRTAETIAQSITNKKIKVMVEDVNPMGIYRMIQEGEHAGIIYTDADKASLILTELKDKYLCEINEYTGAGEDKSEMHHQAEQNTEY